MTRLDTKSSVWYNGIVRGNSYPTPVKGPAKADNASMKDVEAYIADDRWWMEQKFDGHRVMVTITDNEPIFVNANLGPYGHRVPAPIRAAFTQGFAGSWVFDGELVGGVYWIFDVQYVGRSVCDLPFSERRELLEHLFQVWEHPACVQLVRTARTADEKAVLFQAVVDSCAEGVIVKRSDFKYRPGRITQMLKIKITQTADVIVSETFRQGKDSIAVEVFHDGRRVTAGAVNMQGKPVLWDLKEGDVIECRYLYVTDGSWKMVQPEFLKIRDDKTPEQCTTGQFKVVDKEVVVA